MTAQVHSKCNFLDLRLDPLDHDQAGDWVCDRAGLGEFYYVVTPNVDHVVQLSQAEDPALSNAYGQADLTLCDSRILSRLAKISGISLPVVPGSDLTRDLLERSLSPRRIAIIGGDASLHRQIARLYPRFEWHSHHPPMGVRRDPDARASIAQFVEEVRADLVLFAIGAPQSELTCAEIKRRRAARGVALCIGASLEFLTGAKKRAPLWMQRSGLEWLFRLLSEPRRLWRRYLVDGPRIFPIWWKWRRFNAARLHGSSGSTPFADE